MLISPSIASMNVLNIEEDVHFLDEHFDDIHIDIEDGQAVLGITFGLKMCKGICNITKSRTSIHLEVINPEKYLDDVVICKPNICFLQADVLEDPLNTVKLFKSKGINTGIAISDRDFNKDYTEVFKIVEHVLVTTTLYDDPEQLYQNHLEKYALDLANNSNLKVWIDGAVDFNKYNELKDSKLFAVVMGRAINQNRDFIKNNFKKTNE